MDIFPQEVHVNEWHSQLLEEERFGQTFVYHKYITKDTEDSVITQICKN